MSSVRCPVGCCWCVCVAPSPGGAATWAVYSNISSTPSSLKSFLKIGKT